MTEESKTIHELLEKFQEMLPHFDDKVAAILEQYPQLLTYEVEPGRPPLIKDIQLGKLLAIAIMDFLCFAYGRPELGYIPPNTGD